VIYRELVKDTAAAAVEKQFASVTSTQYDAMNGNDRIAYLINVYNFYTLLLIKGHYPVKSIRDVDKPWDTKFVPLFGDRVSLNHIEHEILRKQFNEPRLHFALNCASAGCPALAREAYTGGQLDRQLDNAAKVFLSDTTKNRIDGTKLKLSKIFQWYGADFKAKYGGYERYVKQVMELDGTFRVSFTEYDWNLNEVQSCE
jgi:hypothetical protein